MSHDDTPANGAASVVERTRLAARTALGRRDSLVVALAIGVTYAAGYLYSLRQLLPGGSEVAVRVARDPWGRLFKPANSAVSFEPVVLVETERFTYLFSLNTPIGLVLGGLVGLNIAVTYLAWRQPAACGLGASSTGLLAGVPALLSGSVCCGPLVLFVLGIQATGGLVAAFQFMLPAAVVLLVGSLFLVGRQVDPELVAAG